MIYYISNAFKDIMEPLTKNDELNEEIKFNLCKNYHGLPLNKNELISKMYENYTQFSSRKMDKMRENLFVLFPVQLESRLNFFGIYSDENTKNALDRIKDK